MRLAEFNTLPGEEQKAHLRKCCGASRWVNRMQERFPIKDTALLLYYAQKIWWECNETDWLEAFSHHPRIGNKEVLSEKFSSTAHWTKNEQRGAVAAPQDILDDLLKANEEYERKFRFIFIVCAMGKSAEEMLDILRTRLPNDRHEEIKIAATEQNKITILRLKSLLS